MWLLLFTLTALLLLLPLLPAIREWLRATDLTPTLNDSAQALHPALQARHFAERLHAAVLAGDDEMAGAPIASVPPYGTWPLDALERRSGSSQRVWHALGDAELPADFGFQSEVVAGGDLISAQKGVYRALFSGGLLRLAKRTVIKRWAHAHHLEISPGCQLSGPVSADDRIHVRGDVIFSLLHAPIVRFMARKPGPGGVATALPVGPLDDAGALPEPLLWDETGERALASSPLQVAPAQRWRGDVISRDHVALGTGCHVDGSWKVHGDFIAASACRLHGNIVASGRIELGERCAVRGSLISESVIVLGPGCRVGAPEFPATVSAPRIEVAPGVVVHGTLWADKGGRSRQVVHLRGGRALP
jgi:cytoskeletal protein CcmA (bactofilin family)